MESPAPGDWHERLFSHLREVRHLMLAPSPCALEQCRPLLERLHSDLEAVLVETRREPRLMQVLFEVRRQLAGLSRLLETAARFYNGWQRVRDCLAGGYDVMGEPVHVAISSRISVEG